MQIEVGKGIPAPAAPTSMHKAQSRATQRNETAEQEKKHNTQ